MRGAKLQDTNERYAWQNVPNLTTLVTGRLDCLVYARHGRELKRLKSSIRESRYHEIMVTKVLAEGKGDIVR